MSVPLSFSVLPIWSFVLGTQNTDSCSALHGPVAHQPTSWNLCLEQCLRPASASWSKSQHRAPWDLRKIKLNMYPSVNPLYNLLDSLKTCKSLTTVFWFMLLHAVFLALRPECHIIITRWVPIYWYQCSFSIFVETNRRSPTYLLHHFNLHLMLEFAYNSFDSKYGSDPFWSWTQLWCMGCCQGLMALSSL